MNTQKQTLDELSIDAFVEYILTATCMNLNQQKDDNAVILMTSLYDRLYYEGQKKRYETIKTSLLSVFKDEDDGKYFFDKVENYITVVQEACKRNVFVLDSLTTVH